MTESEKRMEEGACIGCSYREHVIFESFLPQGEVRDDAHCGELVAEIEELKLREGRIREMRQLMENTVRNYRARKFI